MRNEKTLGQFAYEAFVHENFALSYEHQTQQVRAEWERSANAVVAAHEARRWRSIETAPKDGTIIDLWVYWPHRDINPQRLADCWWNESLSIWSCLKVYDAGFVATHWTPIPAPPKEADAEEMMRDAAKRLREGK